MFGANVTGYALASPMSEGAEVFAKSGVERGMTSLIGDIRDFSSLKKAFDEAEPELVFHLAAQPIVFRPECCLLAILSSIHALTKCAQAAQDIG